MIKKLLAAFCAAILLGIPGLRAGDTSSSESTPDQEEIVTSFIFGYCGEPKYVKSAPQTGKQYCAAIGLDEQFTAKYDGMKIIGVMLTTGKGCVNMPVEVFVTNDPQNFSYTQSAKMTAQPGEETRVDLDTPYEIKDGEKLLVGFQAKGSIVYLNPICYDGIPNVYNDAFMIATPWEGEWDWISFGNEMGSLNLRVIVEGTGLPTNDASVAVGNIPFVFYGEDLSIPVELTNRATNALTSAKFRITVGEQAPVEVTVDVDVPMLDDKQILTLNAPCLTKGLSVPVKVEVLQVNGVDLLPTQLTSAVGSVMCYGEGEAFIRNAVMEEGTGSWCGWCPRGIVIIERLLEEFPDGRFIPIGVHSGDNVSTPTYSGLSFGSYPACTINRTAKYGQVVDYNVCRSAVVDVMESPAILTIDLTVEPDPENPKIVTFKPEVQFAAGATGVDYRLAFVVTENGVGPQLQANNFAGGSEVMGGWENKPGIAEVYYDEVARGIYDYAGIKGSIPSNVEASATYTYPFTTPELNINDLQYCSFIAMVINARTGVIENATMIAGEKKEQPEEPEQPGGDEDSITAPGAIDATVTVSGHTVSVAPGATATVYTPGGQLIATISGGDSTDLPSGLYILKTRAGARKIALR